MQSVTICTVSIGTVTVWGKNHRDFNETKGKKGYFNKKNQRIQMPDLTKSNTKVFSIRSVTQKVRKELRDRQTRNKRTPRRSHQVIFKIKQENSKIQGAKYFCDVSDALTSHLAAPWRDTSVHEMMITMNFGLYIITPSGWAVITFKSRVIIESKWICLWLNTDAKLNIWPL